MRTPKIPLSSPHLFISRQTYDALAGVRCALDRDSFSEFQPQCKLSLPWSIRLAAYKPKICIGRRKCCVPAAELHTVEDVEKLGPELQGDALRQFECLGK